MCCGAAAEGEGEEGEEEKAAEEEADGEAVKRPAEEEVGFKKSYFPNRKKRKTSRTPSNIMTSVGNLLSL